MVKTFINEKSFWRSKRHRGLIVATLLAIVVGSTTYHLVEGWNWLDAFYFAVITLTTVGYGDFYPQTDIGKLFTIFYVISGIGLMFSFIDAFYEFRVTSRRNRREQNKD